MKKAGGRASKATSKGARRIVRKGIRKTAAKRAKKAVAKKSAKKPAARRKVARTPVKKTSAKVARKPGAKRAATKKPAAKTSKARKPAVRRTAAKTPVAKTRAAKRPAAKRPLAKRPAPARPVALPPPARRAPTQRTPAKSPAARRPAGNVGRASPGRRQTNVAPPVVQYAQRPHSQATAAAIGRVNEPARDVVFSVTLAAPGGEALQTFRGDITRENYRQFIPREDARDRACARLESLGFAVLRKNRFTLSVSGARALIEDIAGAALVPKIAYRGARRPATAGEPGDFFLAPVRARHLAPRIGSGVDHFVFVPPPLSFARSPRAGGRARPAVSATAPAMQFPGPDEARVRQLLNVPPGSRGAGVTVAMIDTGFFPHPYFHAGGFDVRSVAVAPGGDGARDDNGHGTAMAWNVFAVAPEVRLIGVQHAPGMHDAAIEAAAEGDADVISCSWGWDREEVHNTVQVSLMSVLDEGKIVLFAAGNGHHAWPGSQPEVISVGGVHADPQGALEASDYASGFDSGRFPGRRVPDVCGLCGQRPKAIYLMLPTQPGSILDRSQSGGAFPDGDATAPDDGWAGASGTSSATPQIAAVVALLIARAREKGTALTADRARQLLEQTAVPITAGVNAMGFPAAGQPNRATGWGLVDATAALARV